MSILTIESIIAVLHEVIPDDGNSCLEIDFEKLARSFFIAMKMNLHSFELNETHLNFEISDGDTFFLANIESRKGKGYYLSIQQLYKETSE